MSTSSYLFFEHKEVYSQVHELVRQVVPSINERLLVSNVEAYVVYVSHLRVNIKVIQVGSPSRVTKVYFADNYLNGVLQGSGYSIHYNKSLFAKERFKFDWSKEKGLFIHRLNGRSDVFPANGKKLTDIINNNYKRIWRNNGN